jgi:lipopolysaccharide biosynthesis glycosyltransferase
MLRIFIGFDHRQPIAYTTLAYSLMKRSMKPIAITPLVLSTLPINRQGLTPFTYSRFLVPWLCDYQGWAVFLDSDILALDDINTLMEFADPDKAVMVSKNDLRFEWSSVMLFNCAKCEMLNPGFVQEAPQPHSLGWAKNVGELPARWNHLVGYDEPKAASLVHFTQGLPCFPETHDCEYGEVWRTDAREAMSALSWQELMGNSVHAESVKKRLASTP